MRPRACPTVHGPAPLVPAGVHTLLLACLDPEQPQFNGVRRALGELGARPGCCTLDWNGGLLPLHRRRRLARVLIAGHGRQDCAGMAPPRAGGTGLGPADLRLPTAAALHLMACSQGRADLRAAWSAGTGLPVSRVHGSRGETESALSTCLLLHLLEEGVETLARWFPEWIAANDALRPHFPAIREAYRRHAGDPLLTLAELRGLALEAGVAEFVGVIRRHPEYLTGLARL